MSTSRTEIAWTDRTWNPTRGCSRVSPGCGGPKRVGGCYAERYAYRFSGPGQPYEGLVRMTANGPRWTGVVRLVPKLLDEPLHWRKPQRVFVDSMSDLFHESLPYEAIDRVFAVMALAHWHTFQILTKRALRLAQYALGAQGRIVTLLRERGENIVALTIERGLDLGHGAFPRWPLPNVWLGVSCEDQATADERIPLLLQTPAAGRFVSLEPLLGPVTLRFDWLGHGNLDREFARLDWIIAGGESGPGARQMDINWVRSIASQCRKSGTACFVKQLGTRPFDVATPGNVTEEERRRWMADGWTRVTDVGGECFTKHPRIKDPKGGDMTEWPEDLRVREFPRLEGR